MSCRHDLPIPEGETFPVPGREGCHPQDETVSFHYQRVERGSIKGIAVMSLSPI
jgi:hypothetical protein